MVSPSVRAGILATVLTTAFLAALLALYQWMELLVANAGGSLACSINATIDCGPVWGSKAAKAIGDLAHMPVAALGLVWGLSASALAVVLAVRAATQGVLAPWIAALRWTGIAGVASVIGLGAVSLSLGVVCPTCLATYALVLVFAFATLKLPGPFRTELGKGVGIAAGIAVATYLALLVPASRSPKSSESALSKALKAAPTPSPSTSAAAAPSVPGPGSDIITQMIGSLPPEGKQILADVILEYKESPSFTRGADVARFVKGPSTARVELLEWTDVKCGHCAMFLESMDEIMANLPKDVVRIEPRQFPLDKECNSDMSQPSPGDGVRCAGARALICLEGSEKFFDAQRAIFAEQESLSREKVLALARARAADPKAFDACVKSPDTEKKLQADIALALVAKLQGTPHVLLNGKVALPFPPFLYLFLANGGRLDHPAVAALPPGKPQGGHEGHGH